MFVSVCACVCMCVLSHVYSGVCYASVQCMCTFRGPDGDTMCVQRINLWEHNACTKNQSYEYDVHMYRGPVLWDSACGYTYHNYLARYKAIFKQKRPPIRKILSHKKRRSGKISIWQNCNARNCAAELSRPFRKEQHVVHVMANLKITIKKAFSF